MNSENMIVNLNNEDIVGLCNDIYDWEKGNGDLNNDSKLRKLFLNHRNIFRDIYHLKDLILFEAHERFHKVARILIINNPRMFIK